MSDEHDSDCLLDPSYGDSNRGKKPEQSVVSLREHDATVSIIFVKLH
jgi:hypothetical protein